MSKLKKRVLELGGKLYYTDTDSIITDIELPKEMVDKKIIGKLKKEYSIWKGYFIAGKTYLLVLDLLGVIITKEFMVEIKDFLIKKVKGIDATSLTEEDYIKMLGGEKIDTAIKKVGYKDYSDGSVTICKEKVTINSEPYNKRERFYENNIWVDTKPLVIGSLRLRRDKKVNENLS